MIKKGILLLFVGFIFNSCEKDKEISTTGNILLNCKTDHYIEAGYNVYTEYAFIKEQESNLYLHSELRSGIISNLKTEINDLNPGNYYITFYKDGWSNIHRAIQVSSGKTSVLELQ